MMDRRLKERLVGATILVALIVLVVPELLSGPKRMAVPPLAAGLPSTTRSVWVDLATSKAVSQPQSDASQSPSSGVASAAPSAPGDAGSRRMGSGAGDGGAGDSGAGGSGAGGSGAGGSGEDTTPPASSEPAPASGPSVATLKAQSSPAPSLETSPSPPKSTAGTSRPPEAVVAARHAWAVQLGSFASKANAERLVRQLQTSGGSYYVVSGGSERSVRYRVRMGPLADRSTAERAVGKLKAQGHPATVVTPAS